MHGGRWRPSSGVLAVLIAVALLAPLLASGEDPGPGYERTITIQEVIDLVDGRKLDPADPNRCEKVRDLCLAAMCGTLERKGAQKACWDHCTDAAFQKCKAEQE